MRKIKLTMGTNFKNYVLKLAQLCEQKQAIDIKPVGERYPILLL